LPDNPPIKGNINRFAVLSGKPTGGAPGPNGPRIFDAAPDPWPQDVLQIPQGYGELIDVNRLNVDLEHRLGFDCAQNFAINFGQTVQSTIRVPQDGDFWCDGIAATLLDTATGAPFNRPTYLQVTDMNTGYNFFPQPHDAVAPGIPVLMIDPTQVQVGALSSYPFNAAGGNRDGFIQPYCFVRNTSILLTATMPTYGQVGGNNPCRMFVDLRGWTEYANAAS